MISQASKIKKVWWNKKLITGREQRSGGKLLIFYDTWFHENHFSYGFPRCARWIDPCLILYYSLGFVIKMTFFFLKLVVWIWVFIKLWKSRFRKDILSKWLILYCLEIMILSLWVMGMGRHSKNGFRKCSYLMPCPVLLPMFKCSDYPWLLSRVSSVAVDFVNVEDRAEGLKLKGTFKNQ